MRFNGFLGRIIVTIIWPIFPILIKFGILLLEGRGFDIFNESNIIMAFVLPITFLPDHKNSFKNLERFLIIGVILCCVPFALYVPYIVNNNINYLYAGLGVLIIYICGFLIWDYFKSPTKTGQSSKNKEE